MFDRITGACGHRALGVQTREAIRGRGQAPAWPGYDRV